MRRGVVAIVLVMAAVLVFWRPPAYAAAPPSLSATAAVLIDGTTGQVLYARNPLEELYPASITKIMTAYLAINSPAWRGTLTVSAEAASQPGSSAYLRPGQVLPVAQVAQVMMLTSGNDAAWALAQAVSGHERAFVALMNQTARAWGAPGIHFANPTGLPLPNHVVTALGMAIIARRAMENPIFRHLVSVRFATLPPDPGPRLYYNQNELLYSYPGANGIKLGYTIEAGETLAASATRRGQFLIAILLHDTPTGLWPDAASLLSWGFATFRPTTIVRAHRRLVVASWGKVHVPVTVNRPVVLLSAGGGPLPSGTIRLRYHWVPGLERGHRGSIVGQLSVIGPYGQVLATRPLRALRAWAPPAPRRPWHPAWPAAALVVGFGYTWWTRERPYAA